MAEDEINERDVQLLLAAAVAAIGGQPRDGQREMTAAVAGAFGSGEHLLVQAGTGTGKSLAYLVPAIAHGERVVVSTATIALQSQLVQRDLPRIADALAPLLDRRPTFAVVKGRSNYACLHRIKEGAPNDDGDALFDATETSPLGRDAKRLREWVEQTETGDKSELVPSVDARVWRASSVSSAECIGAQKCAYGEDCFAERAREKARESDVVVTNHALLTIGALESIPILPEYDAVVVDEAHELADQATNAATVELSPAVLERVARRARRLLGVEVADALDDAAAGLGTVIEAWPDGQITTLDEAAFAVLSGLRDTTRAALGGLAGADEADAAAVASIKSDLDVIHDVSGRLITLSDVDVAWLSRTDRAVRIRVAPLSVSAVLRSSLFDKSTVVLTSATLELGGSFAAVATSLGLDAADGWRGLDVGSPFDYGKQGILYTAAHLPPPGRDGLSDATLTEIVELIEAAGGRTLALFSSRRAAEQAAVYAREHVSVPLYLQGDDDIAALVACFAADGEACLFGTMSLWQGVDVPGDACILVIVDRIPFPRPDDPLLAARQRVVDAAGGSGFREVALPRAALKLAQGTGRLIRSAQDRGVVAILDSRLATGSYAAYIRKSLPPFYPTTNGEQVRASLSSLRGSIEAKSPTR